MDRIEFLDLYNNLLTNESINIVVDKLITEYCIEKGKTNHNDINKVKQAFMLCIDNNSLISEILDHFKRKFEIIEIIENNKILKIY